MKRRSAASTVRSPPGPVSVRRTFFGFAAAGVTAQARAMRTARPIAPLRARARAPATPVVTGRTALTFTAPASVAQELDVDQRRVEDIDAGVVVLGVGGDQVEAGPGRIVVAAEAEDLLAVVELGHRLHVRPVAGTVGVARGESGGASEVAVLAPPGLDLEQCLEVLELDLLRGGDATLAQHEVKDLA